ncbi:hypothetical protein LO80_04590 [Candidatus Francisella endociliophora]|uniref:Uncharacterized protein n=1 Tax=Candidatus Francisella endociliophora TaxID=653937 RepID=A0A097EP28_9GAMM|nr:hypothetical protein [Francisella sp. FSC1006]AIT09315.1 hypothetical protein LO80_04590 [Francisella sp. FSC1006]
MKNHFKKLFVLFCIIFSINLSVAAKKEKTNNEKGGGNKTDTTKNGNGNSNKTDTSGNGNGNTTDSPSNGNGNNNNTNGNGANAVDPSNFQFYRDADGRRIYIIKDGLQCTIDNTCQESDKIYIDSNCELNGDCEALNNIQDISTNLGIIHQQQA